MIAPVEFLVAGTPRPQGSKSLGHTKDGRAFMREGNDAQLRPWRKTIKAAAVGAMLATGLPIFDGPVGVVLTFGMRWPVSHRGRPTWPTARPDVDKLARAALDAITGVVVVDDSQIVSMTVRKVWAERDVPWPQGLHVWANYVPGFLPTIPSAR